MADERPVASRRLERFHLARAACWPTLAVYILLANPSLAQSVALVIGLSLYANFAGDVAAWQAARAERRSLEHPPAL